MLLIRLIEYYETIFSTNDRVKELLKQTRPPELPCLVVAKQQTAGRGRGNKVWWSGKGSLLMSLGLDLPSISLTRNDLPEFSFAAAQSVIKILRRRLPEKHLVTLHEPNDVYVDGKKICGILTESPKPEYAVLGIGLNINNRSADVPPEFRTELEKRQITSMIDILGDETPIILVLLEFLHYLGAGQFNRPS
jgi:BirA family biotin operon repressor/biotin-[acetyl-CoA-carboxylase] ligase